MVTHQPVCWMELYQWSDTWLLAVYGNEQGMTDSGVGGEMKDVLIKKGLKILVELSKGLGGNRIPPEMYQEVYFSS